MLGMAATGAVATSGIEPSEDVALTRLHGPGAAPPQSTPTMLRRCETVWGPRQSRHSRRDTAKGHVQMCNQPEKIKV